jgi:hypothetical protein
MATNWALWGVFKTFSKEASAPGVTKSRGLEGRTHCKSVERTAPPRGLSELGTGQWERGS